MESQRFSHYLSNHMRALLFFLFFIPFSVLGQFEFQFSTDMPLSVNGQQLNRVFEGGLNSPQFQTMDLDFDGDQDLVLYNRMANNLQTYINENNSYVWKPEYAFQFPEDVIGWIVLIDFDCDGDKDLFTSTSLGIKAYENTSTTELSWEEAAPFLSFDTGTNIQVSRSDIPGFADVNGDGAIDILAYRFGTSTTIDYYENTGNCGDLSFERADRQWGGILECDCDDFQFRQPCSQKASANTSFDELATEHAGGKIILPFDSDNDGDIDIITSDEFCETLYFMENEGDQSEAVMNSFSSYPFNNPAGFPFFPNAFLADIDFDNVNELVISTNADENIGNRIELSSNVKVYDNQGSNNLPEFNQAAIPFLQNEMLELGENLFPAFADLDEDGDDDLFIGNKGLLGANGFGGAIYYFENIGNEFNPVYELVDDDFMNIRETNQTYIKPFFVDTDGDGDLDLVYQASSGPTITRMYYQMNNGNFNFSQAITLNIDDMTFNDNPFFYDVDEDGDPDILFGTQFGGLSVFYNRASMIFSIENPNFGGISDDFTRQGLSVYVADMEGNGTDDLVTIDNSGEMVIYRGPINDSFEADEPITDLININDEFVKGAFGRQSILAISDLKGNSKPTVVIGTIRGGLYLLENTSEIQNTGEDEIIINASPNPSNSTIRVTANTSGLLSVYNKLGQTVAQGLGVSPSQPRILDVSNIPAGVYIIRFLNNSGKTAAKKVIVVK